MLPKKLKVLAASFMMLFSTASLFAVEEYVSKIYKNIDLIFVAKSGTDLNRVLSENSDDKYYYLIENYTEKKIRRLIVNNDYDFAMEAIVIVIENNLDNEQAVEMYSVISEAYAVQQEYERQEEIKKQQEIARIEAEKEKKRAAVDKEYVAAAKSQGGAVYVSGKETKLTSSLWKASLGMADISYLFEQNYDLSSFAYGIALDYRYSYIMPTLIIGTDVFFDANFLGFDEEKQKAVGVLLSLDVFGKLAIPPAKNLFFRAGFTALKAGSGEYNNEDDIRTDIAYPALYSPSIGIKMESLKIGASQLDFGVDWYAAHLWSPDLNFAAGAMLNMIFPYAETERVKLTFNLGVKDRVFIKSSGLENRANVILAIGVENVVK